MMKFLYAFFALFFLLYACETPKSMLQSGAYVKALESYAQRLQQQKKGKFRLADLKGLETAFQQGQRQDLHLLDSLETLGNREAEWPNINLVQRRILYRQNLVSPLQPLRSRKGYLPALSWVEDIQIRESDSRQQAATYLYARACSLLAITDSSGDRRAAREAYYTLKDLRENYYPVWEDSHILLDSAYSAGKTHVLLRLNAAPGVTEGQTFWSYTDWRYFNEHQEWLQVYADSTARSAFDFIAQCTLNSMYVGSESSYTDTRTETIQVEDGYTETCDSTGKVVSRTPKYRCETKSITTWHASRDAHAGVALKIMDRRNGRLVAENPSVWGQYNFSESSEYIWVTAPSYYGMVQQVASSVQGGIQQALEETLIGPTKKKKWWLW